jgi:DNA repair exonuclease SbcCD ATPase subunit
MSRIGADNLGFVSRQIIPFFKANPLHRRNRAGIVSATSLYEHQKGRFQLWNTNMELRGQAPDFGREHELVEEIKRQIEEIKKQIEELKRDAHAQKASLELSRAAHINNCYGLITLQELEVMESQVLERSDMRYQMLESAIAKRDTGRENFYLDSLKNHGKQIEMLPTSG